MGADTIGRVRQGLPRGCAKPRRIRQNSERRDCPLELSVTPRRALGPTSADPGPTKPHICFCVWHTLLRLAAGKEPEEISKVCRTLGRRAPTEAVVLGRSLRHALR